jgi:hypothetical protein
MKGDPLDSPDQVVRRGDTITVALWYPGCEGHARHVEVELVCVRAADSIRIHYDYDRDGYVVEQPKRTEVFVKSDGKIDTYEEREEWIEMAFLKAWPFEAREDAT